MQLIMMGTGPFAVPTFRELFETHHSVVAMVTAPVRPRHDRHTGSVSPMRDLAHEHGVPIFDPEDVNSTESELHLARYGADLLVVSDYGQILAAQTLAAARLGGVNLHASLLPKYRGAAPINWALYHGEAETGVTVIHMTPEVDAGPCIAQADTPLDDEETAVELEERLSEMGAWLIRRAIDAVEAGRLEALPQDPGLASRAPRLRKIDGLIDWTRAASAIRNHVRAMEPWPKTYTFWHNPRGRAVRLILGPVAVADVPRQQVPPGTVLDVSDGRMVVATGDGDIRIENIQPAGKQMMDVGQFLRGYRVQPGDRLGPE